MDFDTDFLMVTLEAEYDQPRSYNSCVFKNAFLHDTTGTTMEKYK